MRSTRPGRGACPSRSGNGSRQRDYSRALAPQICYGLWIERHAMKTIWRPVRFQLDPPETVVTLSGKPQSSSATKVGTALAVAILVVSATLNLLAQAAP